MTETQTFIILLILSWPLIRASLHGYWLMRTRALHSEHKEFLRLSLSDDTDEKKAAWAKVEHTSEVEELLRRAQVRDLVQTRVEPKGLGMVQQAEYSGYENLFSHDKNVVQWVMQGFHEAAGFYRKGIRDSLNPLYWIDRVIMGPQNLAISFGLQQGSPWITVTNVGFWGVVFIGLALWLINGFGAH